MSTLAPARKPLPVPPNGIAVPFSPGQRVVIPKGTRIRTTMRGDKREKTAGRAYTVTAHHVSNGWVDTHGDHRHGRGYVLLPEVIWPGESQYWHSAQVTPELCAANGVGLPALPEVDLDRLDTVPGYGPGYDNTWAW